METLFDGSRVNAGIAFLAGLVSFLSGCHIPLLPVYFSYFLGLASTDEEDGPPSRWMLATHGIAFSIGFLAVFMVIGLAGSGLASWFSLHRLELGRIFGAVFLLYGLRLLHILNFRLGVGETVRKAGEGATRVVKRAGWASWSLAVLFGVAMALLWIPCIGPVLAVVFYLASTPDSHVQGAFYMALYAIGLMAPIMVIAAMSDVGRRQKSVKIPPSIREAVRIITGVVLTILGFLIITGRFTWLSWIVTSTR